jgi:hypothetical protein
MQGFGDAGKPDMIHPNPYMMHWLEGGGEIDLGYHQRR